MYLIKPLPEFTEWLDRRIYFVQRGARVIVLLAGGSKRTQKTDIKRARVLASLLD